MADDPKRIRVYPPEGVNLRLEAIIWGGAVLLIFVGIPLLLWLGAKREVIQRWLWG
jgi:hypothetical protein